MGASNANAVYARWGGLNAVPFRLLVHMALTTRDDDRTPKYWRGQEVLADALGYGPPELLTDGQAAPERVAEVARAREAAFRGVRRALAELERVGAIHRQHGTGHRRSTYCLNLLGAPAATAVADVEATMADAHRPPTSSIEKPDAERPPSPSVADPEHAGRSASAYMDEPLPGMPDAQRPPTPPSEEPGRRTLSVQVGGRSASEKADAQRPAVERKKRNQGGAVAREARRAPLPRDFVVDAGMRAWAAENFPLVDLDLVTQKFVEYYRTEASTSEDWAKTWRRWVRSERPVRAAIGQGSQDVQSREQRRREWELMQARLDAGESSHVLMREAQQGRTASGLPTTGGDVVLGDVIHLPDTVVDGPDGATAALTWHSELQMVGGHRAGT